MNSLHKPIVLPRNITKKAITRPATGITNEHSNIPIEPTHWQKKQRASQERWEVSKMSTRYNNGSHYENHQRAAELHEKAAHAHLSAAEAHEKQDHETGQERSRQALEHSQLAYQHTAQTSQNPVNEHGFPMFGHDDIAVLAHQQWQARGCPEGSPDEDWSHAAQQLRDRKESHQQ